MTSGILNLIFDKFLSNIVEIDTSKTSFSIFSGVIDLHNLKIKAELFQTLNLPFVEVVQGYVGTLKIDLTMPFFYNNPIKVFIDKIFFHAKMKDINNLNKEDEIKNMQNFKNTSLLNAEQMLAQIEDIKKQNKENDSKKKGEKQPPGLVQKIISNLSVEINDIVFKLDDDISYPEIPYTVGVILDNIKVRSTKSDFKIPADPDEAIPYEEINYKVVAIDNFSIYMDCFDSKEELNYELLIDERVVKKKTEIRDYLKDRFNFYTYCLSEVYVHSRKFESHQYILHQLDLDVKLAMNDNVQNEQPKISAKVAFPQILLSLSLKQIKTILKIVAYLNLNSLYQKGLAKEYYDRELTKNEKNQYIESYYDYFQKKYIEKQNIEYPQSLTETEERLNYETISEMRKLSLQRLTYSNKIREINKKIRREELKLIRKNEKLIQSLTEEKNIVIRKEQEFLKTGKVEDLEDTKALEEAELEGLPDNYTKIYAYVDILITSFTIYETLIKKPNNTWELRDKLLSLVIKDFGIEAKILKVGIIALITLENIIIAQEKVNNPNYNKIFFGDLTVNGKLLNIIFEMNPKLKKSDLRVKVWSERNVYIIVDSYTLQYILFQIQEVLATTIDVEEAGSYAKGSIYNYIKEGYNERVVEGNFTHSNLYLDVSLNCPLILIPVDIFDFDNHNCLLLSLGALKVKSILPPRVDKDLHYEEIKDENLLYDKYRVGVLGIRMATSSNCVEKNNYNGTESVLLNEFDLSVEAKLLIQPKNPHFDNMILDIMINELDFQINEFQILLLIEFLGNMTSGGYKLKHEQDIKKKEERLNRRKYLQKKHAKSLLNLDEKEREKKEKEKEKERQEKIQKRKEEIKKKRLEDDIKRTKVSYEKIIKSFAMSDHSIAKMEIGKVKKGKKSVVVNFSIGKTRFAIKKNYTDIVAEDYLEFRIDLIKVGVNILLNGVMMINFLIKHIILSDVDRDETKQLYLHPNYICLIESAKEGQMGNSGSYQDSKFCFIDLDMLMLGDELDMVINMNDLQIVLTLNSILRLYQFGMYYLEIYTTEMFNVEIDKYIFERNYNINMQKRIEERAKEGKLDKDDIEDKEEKAALEARKEELVQEKINKEYMARLKKYVRNVYTIDKAKAHIKKSHKVKTLDDYLTHFTNVESIKKGQKVFVMPERNRSKMRLIFNMNNTMFKLPMNPTKLEDPLFSMNFDMTFSMDAYNVFDNILMMPSRKILAQIYETKTSKMKVLLSRFEFDMIYFNDLTQSYTHNKPSERLLSNFRLNCFIDSYIVPYVEQSVMDINVVLEPLILAFGMRQVRKLMSLSTLALEFLQNMNEKYFPHVKPEQIVDGVLIKPKKKKYIIKKIFKKIFIRNQLNKVLKQTLKETKPAEKGLFINTNKFNNHMGINCKIDKIGLVLFDNTQKSSIIMLEVNLTKLLVKMYMNSLVKNKDNMLLNIYEMLSGDILPRTHYNLNELGMYLDVIFSMDANYFNIMINDFEPLLERFNMGVTMLQVAPFTRTKGYVTTNDIINFNLSTDCIIALNKFLMSFMQDEKMWEQNTNLTTSLYGPMNINLIKDKQNESEEIILKFVNLTGLDLVYYFDDNPNYKIPLKEKSVMDYTRLKLYQARGHDRHINPYQTTTFSLCIGNSQPIEKINFQRNNYKQFKINLQNNSGASYQAYFGVKVESNGIINTVTICSSLSFYNDTENDPIYILINNPNIADNTIIIGKDKRGYVPLTWLASDYANSSVSIKLSDNGQYTKICDKVSDFFIPPIIDPEVLARLESEKSDVQKNFPDANNPTFKKIVDIKKDEVTNRRLSKYVSIDDNGINKGVNLDYFILQSKDIKKLKEKKVINDEANNEDHRPIDLNTSVSELIPASGYIADYDYEYIIYVRPSLTIVNKIPYTINITSSEGNKIIETLGKEYFYNPSINDMKFTMEYNNVVYTSDTFYLNEENTYVNLTSNASPLPIKCHIFRNPIKLTIPYTQKFFCEIIEYSIQSYEYTFFFDYLFNNRLTKKLWLCPCSSKGMSALKPAEISSRILELPPSSLSLMSLPNYETNCCIKDENSPWSDAFNMNTIGVQGTVKLNSTNYAVAPGMIGKSQYNQEGAFQANNEVACLLSSSDIYDFSVIIVFEPKYIIINNLGFDITYKQENYTNEYLLRSKGHNTVIYEEGEKDFRIGIYDETSLVTNYSGIFNLENIMDVDIKVKINKNSPKFNSEMKIFSYEGKEYYILIRVINKSYDQGTVYILLTHPLFPYFEISNQTHAPMRVYEEGTQGITISNWKTPTVPFVWDNSNKHKDELYYNIYGREGKFNYGIFNNGNMEVKERATNLSYSVSSKNKTSTRIFIIKEEDRMAKVEQDAVSTYITGKSRTSSYFDIFIRGFGISIIDNTPQEIFYISFYNIRVKFRQNVLNAGKEGLSRSTMNLETYIDNIQIDYCLNDSLRTVLAPKDQIVPSTEGEQRQMAKAEGREIIPFVSVLLTMTTKSNHFRNEQITYYDQIDFVMQEFDIRVEQYALMNLLKVVMEMVGALDFATNTQLKLKEDKEPLLDIEMHIPVKKLLKENENSVMQLIYYLLVGALKFNLTLRLDLSSIPLGLPKLIKRVIGTIGNTLGRITDCPLRFNEKVVENVYMSWPDVAKVVYTSYISQGITQIYKVLGSLDIIGNPVKLVRNVGGGFYDFVNEPRKGFRLGPKEFGIGVAKGLGSLVYGIVGGIFDFIQRISGTLYAATQSLTGHERDSISIEDENEPMNIWSGFGQGCVGFGKEIGKGCYSLCVEPCSKGSTKGAVGFTKGLCSGLLKLFISPFAGILKFITCVMAGCKNSCYYLTGKKKLRTSRFRHPRVIVEGGKKLMPYEDNKAEAREMLYQLEKIDNNNIIFADDFICPTYPRRFSSAILTDRHMYVVYDMRKIIFKLNLAKVSNVSLHYIDDKFILAFKTKNNMTKGFPIKYDYSTVATELHDILYNWYNKSQIMYSYDGKQGPVIVYNDLTVDDLFDKSSYTNTLIGEQSVYSDKTLFSKLTVRNNKKNNEARNNMNNINNINNNKNNQGFENESVQHLNPKMSNSEFVALNVK